MVFLLSIMSAVLELMIAARIPLWRRLSYRSKLFNLLNSLFVSYLIGLAFGAQGLIAMTAGVFSTFLTIPGYAFLHWNMDSEKARKTPQQNRYQNFKEKMTEPMSDMGKIAYVTIKIITAPLWIPRRIYGKLKGA
jgi:glucan phosphoethanolaminetransferase (alkaline phosphatase superfamily)